MVRSLVIALACLVFATSSPSQTDAPKEAQKPSIQGKVVDAKSGLPIRKVNVQLRGGAGRASEPPSATTGADGTFTIEDLEPGRYFVILERTGFVQMARSRTQESFTLQPSQQLAGLVFQMQPAGVISGKIADLDGDPMPGVNVTANLATTKGLAARQNSGGMGRTDDRGEYRISDLKPGKYLVMAQPPQVPVPAGKEEKTKGRMVYASTYYPGTVDKGRAVAVQVRGGDEISANFTPLTSHVFNVSGTVSGVTGGMASQLILFSTSGDGGGGGAHPLGEGNKFEFQDLLPGTYAATLMVIKGIAEGSRPDIQMVQLGPTIEVGNADVEDLRLHAEPGGQVRGKFRLDTEEKFDWTQLTVQLQPAAESAPYSREAPFVAMQLAQMNRNSKVSSDGSFEMTNVPAGNYQVVVGANSDKLQDYYTKSVTVGGRDVADSGFDVNGDAYVDVLISAKGATIEGSVVDSNGQPAAYGEVAVIPNSEHRARPDSYQRASTDEHGHFVVRGLNPGSYLVLAFEELEEDTKQLEFFKTYAVKGEKVELEEGARKSVTAKLIPPED